MKPSRTKRSPQVQKQMDYQSSCDNETKKTTTENKNQETFYLETKTISSGVIPNSMEKNSTTTKLCGILFHFASAEKSFCLQPYRRKNKSTIFSYEKTPVTFREPRPGTLPEPHIFTGFPRPEAAPEPEIALRSHCIFSKTKNNAFSSKLWNEGSRNDGSAILIWGSADFCRTEAIQCWRKRGRYQEGTSTSLEPRIKITAKNILCNLGSWFHSMEVL